MIGRTLLHYTITAELGAGAMGRVFLARDTRTDRQVALKLLSAQASGPEARERLQREARAAARLSHPGIVTLHALEEADGELFLVQEYVEGETLARRLERGALGPQEALRLARELASALAHAHAQGVLHRDLKPENVLVGGDGRYRIADFGIARLAGSPTLTRADEIMGSLPYMAPERLRGHAGDARADLFALGAILYEAVSGRRAFLGDSEAEVMYAVLNETPAPPVGSSLAALGEVALRLLDKEPSQRPPSAEAVAGMLEGIETARTAPHKAARAARPRRLLVPVAAALLLALGAGVVWRNRAQVAEASGPALAVIAFDNVREPADPERLGAVAAHLLVTSLAQVPDLEVVSAQRMLDALGDAARAPTRTAAIQAARRAGATRIVTGSVLQTEPTFVMTAEVADVRSGRVLHAERVEGQLGQTVFQVVDVLSARLLSRMKAPDEAIRLQPVARRTSTDLEAQRDYALGLEALTRGHIADAAKAFAKAVERDSGFAQAHFQLAIAQWWQYEPAVAATSLDQAERHADRLSPSEREALAGVRLLVDRRWREADATFERLANRYPDDKLILYGVVEAAYHGEQWDRAAWAGRRLLQLDPRFTIATTHLIDALREMRQLDEAEAMARTLIRRDPRNGPAWWSLFRIELSRSDGEGALAVADSARVRDAVIPPLPYFATQLALNLQGREAAARWLPRAGERPALEVADARRGLDYNAAMREGRFRDALRIAEASWRAMPIQLRSADIRPPIPTADGIGAALALEDTVRMAMWRDSVTARLSRWDRHIGLLAGAVLRLETMRQTGQRDRMAAVLRELESNPGAMSFPGQVRYMRAIVEEAMGRPEAALVLLRDAVFPGPPWLSGTVDFDRARNLIAARRPGHALFVIDTLMRAPRLAPDDAVRLHLLRGRALERLGRNAEAVESYRALLRLWKDAPEEVAEVREARVALARLGGRRAARRVAGPAPLAARSRSGGSRQGS
jgi:serine/threonine-protein kinase